MKVVFLLLIIPLVYARAAYDEEIWERARFFGNIHSLFSSSRLIPGDPNRTAVLLSETLVRSEYSRYTASVNFSNRIYPGGDTSENNPFNLEKKTLSAEWEIFQLKLGDVYQEMGKGIALSLYKDPVLGVDNTIEGASFRFHPEGLDLRAFAGRVNALKSPVALNPVTASILDTNVLWMGGGSITLSPSDDWKIGTHYFATINERKRDHVWDRSWHTAGISLTKDALFGSIDTYFETNMLMSEYLEGTAPNPDNGYGSFASASWVSSPLTIKLEGKDYRNYRFDFRRPPTLEDDSVQEINTQDSTAVRLSTEYKIEEYTATLSYLVGHDRQVNAVVNHPIISGKFPGFFDTTWEWKAGYRWLPQRGYLWHVSLKNKIPTFTQQSLELSARKLVQEDNVNSAFATLLERNVLGATYNFSDHFNVNLGYEYVPFNPEVASGKNFLSASAQYKSSSFTAKAFVGRTSGGTVCSGGVCAKVPPFDGGMGELTLLF